jgi:hypothetical protein
LGKDTGIGDVADDSFRAALDELLQFANVTTEDADLFTFSKKFTRND